MSKTATAPAVSEKSAPTVAKRYDFVLLFDVTDGNLGAHLRKLEEAGYIAVNKTFVERKPRTFVAATTEGRKVFQEHVAALESILKGK